MITSKIQKDAANQINLQDFHQTCTSTCRPQKELAEKVIEQRQARANFTGLYTLDKQEMFDKRLNRIEEVIVVEKANLCLDKCSKPIQIFKKHIQSQFKIIQSNVDECVKTARVLDKETQQTRYDYDKVEVCLVKNIEILNLYGKKLKSGIPKFRSEFMD